MRKQCTTTPADLRNGSTGTRTDAGRSGAKRHGKTFPALLCAVLTAVLVSGCGGSDVQRYAWPLATASPEDTVTQIYAEKFAEEVYRLSGERMKIQVYANSVLGGDRELLESCADGDIPFVVQNTAPQVTFMPDLSVFDLPCVFDSLEECRAKLDEPDFYESIGGVYTAGGYHLLGIADQGFRVMSTNKAVHSLADFRGQKIRTMENPFHLAFWTALGASPTPMTFSEVYIGLQQHTIDAQENPYEVIVSNRLYEQQDYIVETNHLPHLITLIVNDDFFRDLPEADQAIMTEAAELATEYARSAYDERIQDRIAAIEETGTEILTLDSATREDIRTAARSVYETIRNAVRADIYEAYTNQTG